MSESDKFEDVTKVHPTDLDVDDGNLVTEATELRAAGNESTTEMIDVSSTITHENAVQPSLLRIKSEHKRPDSHRKETTLDRVSEVKKAGATEDGTSPGILLPSDEHQVLIEDKPEQVPLSETGKPVRPITNTEPNQDITAPIVPDPSEIKPRAEPTKTFAPRSVPQDAQDLERNRARSESLLQRIGVPAEVPPTQPPIKKVSEKSDTVEIKEKPSPASSTRAYRNNTLWIWAAIFGALALLLVIVATILFTRSG